MTKLDEILNKMQAEEKPEGETFKPKSKPKSIYQDIDREIEKRDKTNNEQKKKEIDFENGSFKDEESRNKIRLKFTAGKSRKERKRIMQGENDLLVEQQKLFIGLFAVAIFAIFIMYIYFPANDAIMSIVLIMGVFLFLPVGFVLGWLLLDPIMRCKILRKVTKGKKNFGIVMFVGKANKIVMKIKNFDEDLIWIGTKCWVLAKGKIKEITNDGSVINEGKEIDATKMVALSETIPVMFIDLTSMEPLSFREEGREKVSPEEIGSFMKSWVDNQMAKIMFLKKTLDIYFIIVIMSCLVAAYFGYTNNQELGLLKEEIETLKQMIASS